VALHDNLLERIAQAEVTIMVWQPGEWWAAPLILFLAEAACTPGFLEYTHGLAVWQRLDRTYRHRGVPPDHDGG
jgi:hypothetical protein